MLDNVSLGLGKQRDQFRLPIESKMDNPLATIESFNRQFQSGEKEREAVEWKWNQEPGKTQYTWSMLILERAQFEGFVN